MQNKTTAEQRKKAALKAIKDTGTTLAQIGKTCKFFKSNRLSQFLHTLVDAGEIFCCRVGDGTGRAPVYYFRSKSARDGFKACGDAQAAQRRKERQADVDRRRAEARKLAGEPTPQGKHLPLPSAAALQRAAKERQRMADRDEKDAERNASRERAALENIKAARIKAKRDAAALPVIGMDSAPRTVSLWDESRGKFWVDPNSVPKFRYGSAQA